MLWFQLVWNQSFLSPKIITLPRQVCLKSISPNWKAKSLIQDLNTVFRFISPDDNRHATRTSVCVFNLCILVFHCYLHYILASHMSGRNSFTLRVCLVWLTNLSKWSFDFWRKYINFNELKRQICTEPRFGIDKKYSLFEYIVGGGLFVSWRTSSMSF